MVNDNKLFDLLVVGGGIFGLWVAKRAVEAGLSVALCDKAKIGSGASGGLLGALMPHIPTGWNEKKQFQLDALVELEALTRKLEEETGQTTGYKRRGRIMPLRSERFLDIAIQRERAGERYWTRPERTFQFSVQNADAYNHWLSPRYAPHGCVFDTLAASVNPREYIDALKTWLLPRTTLFENAAFESFDGKIAHLAGGTIALKTKRIVLAQGYETFQFLNENHDLDLGTGIKGQAAKFQLDSISDMPVIYDDGVYVVPHEDGTCAVGSTTEKYWMHPDRPDSKQSTFVDKAREMCPLISDLQPIEEWAGVRPKCHEREPIIGRLFDDQEIFVATGGFKISFGIAHRVAQALIEEMVGKMGGVNLPETFRVDHHLKAYKSKAVSSLHSVH